jgi:hypothetical protein
VAAKVKNFMNLMNLAMVAKAAKITGVGAMTTFGLSVSPQWDRAGLAC